MKLNNVVNNSKTTKCETRNVNERRQKTMGIVTVLNDVTGNWQVW